VDFKKNNQRERLKFVDFWSKYVLGHDDEVWSKQQNIIINSGLKNAYISKKLYMKLKGRK